MVTRLQEMQKEPDEYGLKETQTESVRLSVTMRIFKQGGVLHHQGLGLSGVPAGGAVAWRRSSCLPAGAGPLCFSPTSVSPARGMRKPGSPASDIQERRGTNTGPGYTCPLGRTHTAWSEHETRRRPAVVTPCRRARPAMLLGPGTQTPAPEMCVT